MQVSWALNPRRIARTLVTVFVLSLIQTVVPPVVSPIVSAPKAEAVDVAYASFTAGTDVVVPAGVFSITLTARGGAGGTGGNDGVNAPGTSSTNVGYAAGTFAVTPGDRISIYPGGAGGNGTNSASNSGGGTAGAASIPTNSNVRTPSAKINGVYTDQLIVNGGAGGPAGVGGSSGGGAGGGAASLVLINDDVALIAAGGGGGGGGSGGVAQNTTVFTANTSAMGANGINGGTCGNTDGGGTGGGGGGWYGGAAGVLDRPNGTGECRAFSGSRGTNFVSSTGSSTTDSYITPNGAGFITYVFNYSATTACTTDTQIVDIYTVVKVTTTANCTWTVPSTVSTVDLFLVGGGGGGAGDGGPGGNGGFGTSRTAVPVNPNSTMTLKVGYGGAESNWGFRSDAFYGDSTTVVTSTGAIYYALGGATAGNNPGAAATAVQTAQNGSFAGGKGGDGAGCFNVGTAGKRGISNYFYGTLNTYGGGGGAGACPNGAATTPAAGADGGGAGGYASSSTVNQPGSNGTNGTGGGGGGGTATGSGLKLPGGKGGSGVILIRYATNAADSFPVSVASALSARWAAGDLQLLDGSRRGWIDSSGINASRDNSAFAGTPTLTFQAPMDGANSTYSSKTLLTAAGGQLSGISLAELPTNYTLFHNARYVTGGRMHRIIQTSNGNWLSGHYYGYTGFTHHNWWLTPHSTSVAPTYGWLLSTDQLKNYRANGVDIAFRRDYAENGSNTINAQSTSTGFGINRANPTWNEYSDWQVNDVLVFNRELTSGEMRLVETYMSRIYGLTLAEDARNSETDTAATFSGSQYFWTEYGYNNILNDTFTVEAWVKPDQSCINAASSVCGIFNRETALVTRIYQGNFEYALYGSTSSWEWINTNVKVPANEWHHIAIQKDQAACVNGSLKVYLDGQLAYVNANSPYRGTALACGGSTDVVYPSDTWSFIGTRDWNSDRYYGQIDEVKVWRVARTAAQIAEDMHSNDTSNPLLQMYYDFNRDKLSTATLIPNLAYGGPSRSEMKTYSAITYADVKTTTVSSAYTTINFPRTYINQYGGWKVPDSVTAATTIVVGGGGGAGKSDSNMSAPGGAGGGGGVTYSPTQRYTPGGIVPVKVGVGGLAARTLTNDAALRSGGSSYLGIDSGLTALGGGGGGSNGFNGAGGSTLATGGGGGGSPAAASSCSMLGYSGGTVPSGYNGAQGGWGWGGLGGSSRGASITSGCYGTPGDAFVDPITNVKYGFTGSNQFHANWSTDPNYTKANNGWGGSVSYGSTAVASGIGMNGSTGVVVIRYITPFKPSFTKPTNAYLNVGMTETFTTNVAQDSATVGLTRTFRWESTTAGANGTFTPIKVGTGAANAAFSWVPTDTSTSGSQYLYRVVVTDSDTVGLFTQDTSPAVFAVINKTLLMTGPTSIKKQINIARNETFTISDGTPSYRYTLTPIIPGVTLDTTTVGTTILRISDTASAGTYLETLTVTDSVSASVAIPISLTISAPPSLVNYGEVATNGQVLHLDFANSASYSRATGVITDISGRKKVITQNGSPTYVDDYSGILKLNSASTQFLEFTNPEQLKLWTLEVFMRIDSSLDSQETVITGQFVNTNISFSLGVDSTRTIFVGFHKGTWKLFRSTAALDIGVWTHVVGTWDGTTMRLYFNGVEVTSGSYDNSGVGPDSPKGDTDQVYIGRYWNSTSTMPMSLGITRIYNRALSGAEVLANYNASKDRFAINNINQIKPSQKYGTITLESFTVTSGGDTETVTFAVGNRDGITWDTTSTPGQVKLTVQETLTPGTYYDTITVTDNFAQSTFLPIKFTVSKADTITIYVDTPTALNYTGNQALFTPSVKTIGAVGLESGTAISTTVRFKPAGTTCATGGYCRIGDIGPGGGIVFIDTSTASSDGRIYEVAPQNWSGSDDLSTVATYCSNNNSNIGASQVGIGWGETNTNLAKTSCLGGAVAKVVSFNSSNGTGYSDWFIPSKNEAIELAKIPATAGLLNIGNNWNVGNWGYWASTEVSSSVMWAIGHVGATFAGNSNVAKSEATRNMVRPVRAFRSCWAIDTCTALLTTETPTAAGIYVISPTSGASAATLAERYSSVRYIDSRLTINRIAQRAQVIPFINVNFPDTFTVNVIEGNGNGAVSYSATNGTSTGCAFDYKKLYASTQGTCTVTVVKAGDRNYLPDTATAGMLLLSFANNQPSPSVGSGPNIALSGQTSVTLDPNVAPTISSLSTYTAQAGVTSLIITGAGFDSSNLAGITVKFWRNVLGTGFTVNAQNSQITVTVPVGATTGKVTVTTPNGQAVSEFVLTITP